LNKLNNSINKKFNNVKSKFTPVSRISYNKRNQLPLLAQRYEDIANKLNDADFYRWSNNVRHCSHDIEYAQFESGKQRIVNLMTCKDRLCGICNYRRSARTYAKLMRVFGSNTYLNKNYNLIFLTLTLRNVPPSQLKQGINHIFYSFNKFLKNKRIKAINKGFYRTLELEFNKDRRDYHHHLHVLIAVNKSYFTDSKQYLSQAAFTDIWQSSAGLDYKPFTYVEKVRDDKGISYVCKYSVKSDMEFIKELTDDELFFLRQGLAGRRLNGIGGVFKEIASRLKLNLDDDDKTSKNITDEYFANEVFKAIYRLTYQNKNKKYKIAENKKTENFTAESIKNLTDYLRDKLKISKKRTLELDEQIQICKIATEYGNGKLTESELKTAIKKAFNFY